MQTTRAYGPWENFTPSGFRYNLFDRKTDFDDFR